MSGASGKVPAAIHVSPECADGGPLSRVRNGDMIVLDAEASLLDVELTEQQLMQREPASMPKDERAGIGREMFAGMRAMFTPAEDGALSIRF